MAILTQLQTSKKIPHPQFGQNWKVRKTLIKFLFPTTYFFPLAISFATLIVSSHTLMKLPPQNISSSFSV